MSTTPLQAPTPRSGSANKLFASLTTPRSASKRQQSQLSQLDVSENGAGASNLATSASAANDRTSELAALGAVPLGGGAAETPSSVGVTPVRAWVQSRRRVGWCLDCD